MSEALEKAARASGAGFSSRSFRSPRSWRSATLFYFRLGSDTQRLPSALIGRPAPQVTLPPLPGTNLPGFSGEDLRARLR